MTTIAAGAPPAANGGASDAMLTDVCRMLDSAENRITRFDVVLRLKREDIAPTIRRAISIAHEWNLEAFAGVRGDEVKLSFVRHVPRD